MMIQKMSAGNPSFGDRSVVSVVGFLRVMKFFIRLMEDELRVATTPPPSGFPNRRKIGEYIDSCENPDEHL